MDEQAVQRRRVSLQWFRSSWPRSTTAVRTSANHRWQLEEGGLSCQIKILLILYENHTRTRKQGSVEARAERGSLWSKETSLRTSSSPRLLTMMVWWWWGQGWQQWSATELINQCFRWASPLRTSWTRTPRSRPSHPSHRPHLRHRAVLTTGEEHDAGLVEFLISLLQSLWPSEKIETATTCHRKFQLLQLCRHWAKGKGGDVIHGGVNQKNFFLQGLASWNSSNISCVEYFNICIFLSSHSQNPYQSFFSSHYCVDVLPKIELDQKFLRSLQTLLETLLTNLPGYFTVVKILEKYFKILYSCQNTLKIL